MAIEELFQFKAYKPNIVDDYLTPIIFIALIIFIPYLVYSTSSAKYT
ncbi:MAG: hypothetical protein LBC61_01335 [Candidatus Peribacteria bacterium]|jgi:hypothetical protein|nr:hypothetical protein [Candidatus Peribacteria bacterium]